jgi:hypothetical protein
MTLLPPDFDAVLRSAIRTFWTALADGTPTTSVDGFAALTRAVARHAGLPDDVVRVDTALPGHFGPTTQWDLTVAHDGRLLAAVKLSAMVASAPDAAATGPGRFRETAPEALALAQDLRAAWQSSVNHPGRARTLVGGEPRRWPQPPFLGYLLLIEDCAEAHRPAVTSGPTFDELTGCSHVERSRILCDRLMHHRVWSSAALLVSEAEAGREAGAWQSFPGVGPEALFAELVGVLAR